MIRVGVVGLGKMGLSHVAIIRPHPKVELAAVCDSVGYVLDVLKKNANMPVYRDYDDMIANANLDAVIIATPSRLHAPMVRTALDAGIHVFCEKPFVLGMREGAELAALAEEKGLVNQVGYHCRFIAAFEEVKRLVEIGAIGRVTHALAETYGPVVLRPKGGTWRTQRAEGGGCLYDYAAHPINLLNWYFGAPTSVGATSLNPIFSAETDDEVYSSFRFASGTTAQLSVNWSDESCRKMTTRVTLWGSAGRIYVDRQEMQVYFRDTATLPNGYEYGWNVRYTTDLTEQAWYYVRGEEYSHQLDHFVRCIDGADRDNRNSFSSAAMTDATIDAMIADSKGTAVALGAGAEDAPQAAAPSLLSRIAGRFTSSR